MAACHECSGTTGIWGRSVWRCDHPDFCRWWAGVSGVGSGVKTVVFFFFLCEIACLAPPPSHLSWCVDVCHFKSYEHRLWELFLIIAYIFSEKRTPGSRGWWVGGTPESPAVPSYPKHPPQQKQPDPARVAVLARLHFVSSQRVPFAAQASASQAQRLLLCVLLFRNLGSTVKIL